MHELRKDESFIGNLAYVIEDSSQIIGHISYSKGFIDIGDEKTDAVILGPVAIHKDYQKQGLGSELIEYTLNLAENEGVPYIFVVGDVNESHVRKIISDRFRIRTIKKQSESHFISSKRTRLWPKVVKEQKKLNQSQLVLGAKLDKTSDFERIS